MVDPSVCVTRPPLEASTVNVQSAVNFVGAMLLMVGQVQSATSRTWIDPPRSDAVEMCRHTTVSPREAKVRLDPITFSLPLELQPECYGAVTMSFVTPQ